MAQLDARPYSGYVAGRGRAALPASDGRVVIIMSTHMRGRGSGLPLVQRVANVREFRDDRLWRATLHPDSEDAVRAITPDRG
jgi:hypothetical protein